jgi:hypothetical protein
VNVNVDMKQFYNKNYISCKIKMSARYEWIRNSVTMIRQCHCDNHGFPLFYQ